MINTKLFEILCCPKCKGDLKYDKFNQRLVCEFEKLNYPIKGDIPVFLTDVEEKVEIEENEH